MARRRPFSTGPGRRIHIILRPRDVAEAKRRADLEGMPYTTWLAAELRRELARERRIYRLDVAPHSGLRGAAVVVADSETEARKTLVRYAHTRQQPSEWIPEARAEMFDLGETRVLLWAMSTD